MTAEPRPWKPGDRVTPETLIVRDEDWPYGLRCGECCRVLRDGEPYAERLTGMVEDVPAVMIVCIRCDTQGVPGA
jgi:hypothetical protein